MHVCVTKHHWLLAVRVWGLAWNCCRAAVVWDYLGKEEERPGDTESGISQEMRSSLDPEMGQARAASLVDRMEILLNLEVAGIGAPHLPDCAPRPLLKPGSPGTITYLGPPSLFTSSHQIRSV